MFDKNYKQKNSVFVDENKWLTIDESEGHHDCPLHKMSWQFIKLFEFGPQ